MFLKDISEEREFVVAVIADSNNDSYIYGKALDTKCNYWKKVITESERPIFIFNKPKEKHNKPCGICVTNQNIYIYESKTDINILPINEINEINTSGKNDSISFTTETKDFRYEVCSSLEMRVNLTNLLIRE